MVGLALITTLPLAVFSLVIVGQSRDEEQRALEVRAQQEADTFSRMVDRQFHDMITTLMILETSPEFQSGDFASFHARANAALVRSGWYMLIVDRDGQQLLNTRTEFGRSLGKTNNMKALEQALATRRPVISDLFYGRTSVQYVYNVMKVVETPNGSNDMSLILTQGASDLKRVVEGRALPEGWSYVLLDSSDIIVASNTEAAVGSQASGELLARAKAPMPERALREGEMLGYTKIGQTGWQVLVWAPADAPDGWIESMWRSLIFAGMACFLLSLASAAIFGRKLQSAIEQIADRADGVGRGEIVPPMDTGIREIDEVSRGLSNASFDRNQAEERLQLVLREMAHRTKNVILVAQSLIRQSARYSEDKDAFVAVITGRMSSFAQSLDRLMSNGETNPTFRELAHIQLDSFLDADNRLSVEGEDFPVISQAVKEIGMVFHELATNAVKYGAWSGSEGRVELAWREEEDDSKTRLRVTWKESGGPVPGESGRKGFGSLLIQSTVQSMGGSAECVFPSEGIVWTMDFPVARIRAPG